MLSPVRLRLAEDLCACVGDLSNILSSISKKEGGFNNFARRHGLSYACKFAKSAKSAESVEFALMSPYAVSLSRNFPAAAFLIQINK